MNSLIATQFESMNTRLIEKQFESMNTRLIEKQFEYFKSLRKVV